VYRRAIARGSCQPSPGIARRREIPVRVSLRVLDLLLDPLFDHALKVLERQRSVFENAVVELAQVERQDREDADDSLPPCLNVLIPPSQHQIAAWSLVWLRR
jgi:hypothetical protein